MHYVPKKFTSYSTNNSSSQPQQQQPQKEAQPKPQKINTGLLTTANSQQNGSSSADKCFTCEKTVYAMEKIEADKKLYHKTCFKCTSCNCPLK